MKGSKWTWLVRILIGGAVGLLAAVILDPYFMDTRLVTPTVCVLCAGLGGAAGAATLPFADDGRQLLLRSGAHFVVTSVLFLLLAVQYYGWYWEGLLLLEGMLALLYALIWLGRWIGWYGEVMQLRTLLGLDAGPSPLKWRETLPYLPFALLLCLVLPLALRWAEHAIQRGSILELPILSGLFYPYVFLPVGGFFSGVSLGKRQGVCPLYPVLCGALILAFIFLARWFSNMADEMLVLIAVCSTLGGNVLGWLYRRAVPRKERSDGEHCGTGGL